MSNMAPIFGIISIFRSQIHIRIVSYVNQGQGHIYKGFYIAYINKKS